MFIQFIYINGHINCTENLTEIPSKFEITKFFDDSSDKVRLGEWSTSVEVDCDGSFCADPVKDVSIAEVIIHEKFNYKLFFTGNNIAVIRLAEKVRYSNFIRPICLPLAHLENKKFIGNDLLLVHWKSSTNGIFGEFLQFHYLTKNILIQLQKF